MSWQPPSDGQTPTGWQATTEDNSVTAVLKRYWKVVAALVVVIGLLIYGMAGEDDIDPGLRRAVDTLAADGDCAQIQSMFDRSDDAAELRYMDAAMRDAGCYD